MDPSTIVTGVISLLMPFVTKSAQELVITIGEVGYEKMKGLLAGLKQRWIGDPVASDALERFEKKPEIYRPLLEEILQEKLSNDSVLAEELAELLQTMGPTLTVIQKGNLAQNITGVDVGEVNSGTIHVTQEFGTAQGMTGAKINRIG